MVAAIGSAMEIWSFRAGLTALRYLFFAAAAGALLGLIGLVMARRRAKLMLANLLALVVALGFVLYLGNLVRIAKSVPAIHDVATDLDDVPQFTRLKVRADNLENIPDEGKPELKALAARGAVEGPPPRPLWRPSHGPARHASGADGSAGRRRSPRERGWETALVDDDRSRRPHTSTFFRFKDDVVVRVRPAPDGGSLVDMRSISRVGGSDVGMNAKRIRAFLADLQRSDRRAGAAA